VAKRGNNVKEVKKNTKKISSLSLKVIISAVLVLLISLLLVGCFRNPHIVKDIKVRIDKYNLNKNSSQMIVYEIVPETAAPYNKVIFTSSNPEVLVVDQDGKMTALKEGETIVTITAGKISKTYKITVFFLEIDDETEEPESDGFYMYVEEAEGTYYASANGMEGADLKTELNRILRDGFTPRSYGDAREILGRADADLEDPTKVWTIYSGAKINATWDGKSWTREHVWPFSRLGTGTSNIGNSTRNQASDLHNLRAIVQSVNSSRGNAYFTNPITETTTYCAVTSNSWFPGDDHKGDVARILLYMDVMYEELSLVETGAELLTGETYQLSGAKMGLLPILLEWHRQDPVDDFEIQRNDIIYEEQNNRNPFIDKPEYVHLIWEGKTINDLVKLWFKPIYYYKEEYTYVF
jgi:endonuclease I